MRWQGERQSENVEDRRGARGPAMVGGGIGTLLLMMFVVWLMGGNPIAFLVQQAQQPQQQVNAPADGPVDPAANDEMKQFVATVLASTEDVWTEQFRQLGKQYQKPKLVLFRGQVRSACGMADAAVGPFYCPGDEQVYLDTSFFDELAQRFQAPGDFAQAYVIAREIGHHVQNQLGISDQVHNARRQLSDEEYNKLSVRLELQADFFAGVWAHHAQLKRHILEEGDIDEALQAATAIGDDRLQKQAQGYVVPDSFTHGTSAQRVRWFRKGFETGDMEQGDTFNAAQL
jgi:predicted metalloprotease